MPHFIFHSFFLLLVSVASVYAIGCSVSGTTTLHHAGDASALASCATFTGNIAIATGTTDNINIPNLRAIRGSLIASNVSQMTQLGADSLESISQTFRLNDVQILSQLYFPRLTSVESISWQGLPNLNALNFKSQVQQVSSVDIQNTFLSSLDGINVRVADKFYIANNGMLQDVTLQLVNVSTSLTLVNNGDRLVASFPNLLWAYNLTFRDASVVSLPSLKYVNGSLGFYENTLKSISCGNLSRVGGSFSIVSNTQLTNTSFPQLNTVGGGFQIANNTQLRSVDGFPRLRNIGGAFDCNGPIKSINIPSLSDIRGAFNLQSTEDIADQCSKFKMVNGANKVIKGRFTCAGSQRVPGGAGSTPTGSSKSSAASRTIGTFVSQVSALSISSSLVMIFTVILGLL